jgi:hypothetical protein
MFFVAVGHRMIYHSIILPVSMEKYFCILFIHSLTVNLYMHEHARAHTLTLSHTHTLMFTHSFTHHCQIFTIPHPTLPPPHTHAHTHLSVFKKLF